MLPMTTNFFSWLLLLVVAVTFGLVSSVFGRSFPMLLTACSLLEIATFVGFQVGGNLGTTAGLCIFGVLGGLMIAFAQWLQRSTWVAQLIANLRCSLARACGSTDPQHFWSQAANPVADVPLNQHKSGREVLGW